MRITWHVAWIVIGLGVIALYLAFYFREGPATRCEYKLPDWRECVVLQDPRPFLAAGFLLLTAGVIGNAGRPTDGRPRARLRDRKPSARPPGVVREDGRLAGGSPMGPRVEI